MQGANSKKGLENYKIPNRILNEFKPRGISLQWRHNDRGDVSNHRPLHCLLNCWFRRRSKKTSKIGAGEFPAQKASNAEMFLFEDVIMISARI